MQITPGVHVISEMIEMMAIKSPLEVETYSSCSHSVPSLI